MGEGRSQSQPASHRPRRPHNLGRRGGSTQWLLPPPAARCATTRLPSSSSPSPSSSSRSESRAPPVGASLRRPCNPFVTFCDFYYLEPPFSPVVFLCVCVYVRARQKLIRWAAGGGRRRRRRSVPGDSQRRDRAEAQGAGQGQAGPPTRPLVRSCLAPGIFALSRSAFPARDAESC